MSGSTLPRRALGRLLRDLRIDAGKSRLAAGLAIEVSKQTVGRVEDGIPARVSTAQFKDLLNFYGADQDSSAEVLGLLQEVRAIKGDPSSGWWRAYSDVVNPHFDHFMSLEQACSRLTGFHLTLLPGLLQTPAYRRWIMSTTDPYISAVDIDRHLELISRRQQRLAEDPDFSLEVLLSESVLRHQVGGRGTMAEQLLHLADIGSLPNVSIRVIPFDAGAHIGLVVQSFTLFEFPSLRASRTAEPPVVFVEGFTGALFLEDEGVIERHKTAVAALREVALSDDATRGLVQKIAKEYAS
ncbi:helix-turn-helix transcriptional regulator [Nocardia sp. CNY236]|uniref:helix-turn-helix domain-containing protein n=1 Tax=Nocardia sp. CNY236 TaxID=1169152 RepID=UPI0004110E76|nr:helix-turn-helix transcriptional regulator [Nocardia sp. CNY236]